MLDEVVGHMREKIEIPNPDEIEIFDRIKPELGDENYKAYRVEKDELVPRMAAFGEGFHFHVTGLMHDEFGFPTNDTDISDKLIKRIMAKVDDNVEDILLYEEKFMEDAEIVVLAYGGTARSAISAVKKAREQGIKVGLFRPITIWPSPEKQINEISNRVKKIIVAEMNLGQYVLEVQRIVAGKSELISLGKGNGEVITPDEILAKIKEVL